MLLDSHFTGIGFSQVPGSLIGSCGRAPGLACRMVWDASHSGNAAKLTAVYLAGPANLILKLIWLVFLALVARVLIHRLINRVTIRAADAPLAHRLRQPSGRGPGSCTLSGPGTWNAPTPSSPPSRRRPRTRARRRCWPARTRP